ncbi:hypothetical protein Tsubulata_002111 [Turnera subulata]|uniref:Thioredoxin domain-containing protein n=1 Tax=Turnera subulata TaxID=218843 RepID=A0A9Q0G173_9ROSI|nr:hypothetical protein Tsubulata_002111 [Turnera subulata]
MAMKNCFQVSTVSSTATAGIVRPFASAEKLHFPTSKVLNLANVSFSSSSSFQSLRGSSQQKPRVICKAAVDQVQPVSDSSWDDQVIASEIPVLVEFWAPWCGPCRMIAPVIDELAKDYAGKISCFKVNTDDCPNIASKYGIRSIPTVLFFKKGEKKESIIGAVPKNTLSDTIQKYLDA